MAPNRFRSGLACGGLIVLMACDRPGPTGPPLPGVSTTLRVEGPASVPPGQNASFRAITGSSGAFEDVTGRAQWETGNIGVATVTSAGVVTGHERGETDLIATYSGARVTWHILVLENGTYKISGRVLDGTVPVTNATVTVSGGTGTGLFTSTRSGGVFALYGVAGEIELTASHDKYRPATLTQMVTAHAVASDISLSALQDPYQMAGPWTLAINRSSACTELPVEWPRNYVASVLQNGAEIKVSLRTDVCPGGCTAVLTGRVSNRSVFIQFPHGDIVDGPWIQELLPSGAFVTIAGEANGDEANDVIEGRLSGDIVYYAPGLRTNPIRCSREDHTFRLSRR